MDKNVSNELVLIILTNSREYYFFYLGRTEVVC